MTLAWKRLRTRPVASCRVFDVRSEVAAHPVTGCERELFVLDSPDWVNVIALTPDRSVVLVEQYRHGTARVTLELPDGTVEPGEDPLAAGLRELAEETGHGEGKAEALGWCEPNPALQSNRCWFVLARGVRRVGALALDEGEHVAVRLEPLAGVPDLLAAGAITHALVLAAFQRFFALGGA
jgi:8-oxo-dGTP pyrophosphatase MutT (NUDIX family)